MKKVTAVDWLAEQYYYSDGKLTRQDFKQAKEMEKQNIIDAKNSWFEDGREQYYEVYGK
jgi:hypothetical protein